MASSSLLNMQTWWWQCSSHLPSARSKALKKKKNMTVSETSKTGMGGWGAFWFLLYVCIVLNTLSHIWISGHGLLSWLGLCNKCELRFKKRNMATFSWSLTLKKHCWRWHSPSDSGDTMSTPTLSFFENKPGQKLETNKQCVVTKRHHQSKTS